MKTSNYFFSGLITFIILVLLIQVNNAQEYSSSSISYKNFNNIYPTCNSKIGNVSQITAKTVTVKVLLVEFKDVKHRNPNYPVSLSLPAYTYDDFNNLLFSKNIYVSPNMYSPDGDRVFGSFRDYYSVMSDNSLDIKGKILNEDRNKDSIPDWLTLDSTKAFYDNNNSDLFIKESLKKATDKGLNIYTNSKTYLVIIYAGHTYREDKKTLNPQAHIDKNLYTMGERFAPGYPYREERDDVNKSTVSKFAHIGIHVHEFAHLLGASDHTGPTSNENWTLMSSGCFNGPNRSGACPAPLNPYTRWKLGWLSYNTFYRFTTKRMTYSLRDPVVYILQSNNSPNDYFLVEYRKFNAKIQMGPFEVNDYNSFIENLTQEDGILVWRKLWGEIAVLIHANGLDDKQVNSHIFPGEKNIRVLNPWSDSRSINADNYWVPNTKSSTNCGLEIILSDSNNYILDLYTLNPTLASPSKPRNLKSTIDTNVNLEWEENQEPDIYQYKIYKKKINADYSLYDSTLYTSYTDYSEIPSSSTNNSEYVYYKITAYDHQNKESSFSEEIQIPVRSNNLTAIQRGHKIEGNIKLEQNYPNPFNASTMIRFSIPTNEFVNITIHDLLGKEVAVLENNYKIAGRYTRTFNANELTSGIYFCTLRVGNFFKTNRMMVMK